MSEISNLKDIVNYQSLSNVNSISSLNILKSTRVFFIRKNFIFLVIIILSMFFTYFFKGKIINGLQNCAVVLSNQLVNYGFAVERVVIDGNKFVTSDYIEKFIDIDKSILFISLSELQKKIKSNNKWIKDVSVKRLLPNVLQIKVLEYLPFANWYHNYGSSIIDDTGHVIVDSEEEEDDLISIYGNEALKDLHFIKKLLNENSVLSNMISSMSYVDGGRWDIVLSSGVNIKLPKENPHNAWNSLLSIYEASNEFLIWKSVDMRIPSQINIIE
ncbi:cell division FtsQ family protein [Ehrlichia chaffeensis str. Heartland]|uniref:Cell division protein FtsQ n=1 Tax=Ehrlichia chaffeensis (strain ATCC CRL-10679 / Arkansas) TaxID=205920 RepID=Q2GHC6_EHRCR|nr:cell division protein FtsQ/DivIB [Ehrlichia chaffeensis]ABD44735.1 putative cell division protein FtsQ [Ehrlichia chaffeensis str. Arkansas]AHX03452.1 cell division FtsQ family protein [Ehrlichia chaffeensis str. Heartland]AHX05828.1 cell division FtsQ family protein [Ehrlichia chaffeensis str. Jax]AHX06820.1 cell division FtsQ family protein [Ehrlichia chaffeensis str. Liberty]AHX07586.1 cell division FtsQ family protein [Ehrlichia chaffeensis str. Osceola]